MSKYSSMSREDLLEEMNKCNWVHTIDVGDGIITPGSWGKGNPEIMKAFDHFDFRGKCCLDIGCWDGQWSFEAEDRGADEIYATDLIDQRAYTSHPTFEIAAALRNSKAKYFPDCSVYEVEKLGKKFDCVIYTGIYYHLKDPVRAFSLLRKVMNTGGGIIIEGEVDLSEGCFANFYYKEAYCNDRSNWFVPTIECLRQWVQCSFFDIVYEGKLYGKRYVMICKAVRKKDTFYSIRPEDLEEFWVDA